MTTGFQVNGVDFDDAFINKAAFYDYAGLWATGKNDTYQLGDGTIIDKNSPVQTTSGGRTWSKRFSTGRQFALAIKTDGTLWAWGLNDYGQLGDNSRTTATSPQVVGSTSNTNWSRVACGSSHTIASKTDGTLWGWGLNTSGQVGDNTILNKSNPVLIFSGGLGNTWTSLSAGENFSAAVASTGRLYTWGEGNNGQLGTGSTSSTSTPTQTISATTDWKQVSCGYLHTSAIKTDGTLWCWGWNVSGQLGTGDSFNFNRSSPIQTSSGGNNWKTVACGSQYTAAIKTDGTLWSWGYNASGQLGDGSRVDRNNPFQDLTSSTTWRQLTAGESHTAALKTDGTLWAWGLNTSGELGDGTIDSKSSPVLILGNENSWISVQIGQASRFTLALAEGKW